MPDRDIYFLYSTLGCHLCDDAAKLLVEFFDGGENDKWQRVEIAHSDELVELYGIRIPVLKHSSNDQELGWPFDSNDLNNFIGSISRS